METASESDMREEWECKEQQFIHAWKSACCMNLLAWCTLYDAIWVKFEAVSQEVFCWQGRRREAVSTHRATKTWHRCLKDGWVNMSFNTWCESYHLTNLSNRNPIHIYMRKYSCWFQIMQMRLNYLFIYLSKRNRLDQELAFTRQKKKKNQG